VEAFASGQQNVVVGYSANEPIVLRSKGVDVVELRVADYVELASNGLMTNEKTIQDNPQMVKAFVGAFLKGLQFTIDNPDDAFALSKSYIENFDSLDQDVQKEILSLSIEMWKGDRLGYSDPKAWDNMNNVLFDMGLIEKELDVEKAFTNEFIP
jgi:NitT/TauT family transport system substrate-binding protein